MATSQDRRVLRATVASVYDLQKLRIQTGLRIVANFKAKLGYESGKTEKEMDENAVKILKSLRASYSKITEGVAKNRLLPDPKKFQGDELITEYTELVLVDNYFRLEKSEIQQFSHLEKILDRFPVWTEYLKGVVGIGPAMASVIISRVDIHKTPRISNLYSLAGLDVAPDGKGRSRRKEHLITRTYVNREGKEAERQSITFDPFLKTKLMGVAASSFLRTNSYYAKFYRNYRNRLDNHYDKSKLPKVHRHWMAMRYMVKMFLMDLWIKWREIENLPVTPSYAEAYLNRPHGHMGYEVEDDIRFDPTYHTLAEMPYIQGGNNDDEGDQVES